MRPAHVVYALAGSPPQADCIEVEVGTRCRVCAALAARAMPYQQWQGANFTDQNKLRHIDGAWTCEACVWAHSWVAPPGWSPSASDLEKKAAKRAAREAELAAEGRKAKEERPPNLRLFSHWFDEKSGYQHGNKADKARLRAWLCAPKTGAWFCAIADSGQKHVLPWTVANVDPYCGVVRFEDRDVFIDCRQLATAIDATCDLLTAGATKDEIEVGRYRPETWLRCESLLREYERAYARERGGGAFALTVWLAQRDEAAVAERLEREATAKAQKKERENGRGKARQNPRSARGADDGDTRRVSGRRGERAQALGPAARPSDAGREDERAHERVGLDAAAPAQPRQSEQLSLESLFVSMR